MKILAVFAALFLFAAPLQAQVVPGGVGGGGAENATVGGGSDSCATCQASCDTWAQQTVCFPNCEWWFELMMQAMRQQQCYAAGGDCNAAYIEFIDDGGPPFQYSWPNGCVTYFGYAMGEGVILKSYC